MASERFALTIGLLVAFLSIPLRAATDDAAADANGDSETLQIATDRPGAGDGSSIVPRYHLQLESGFNAAFDSETTQVNLASTLFRFGLASFAEARVIASPVGFTSGPQTSGELQPLTDVTLGAKVGTPTGPDAAVAALPYATVASPTDGGDWSAGGRLVADIGTSRPVGLSFNLGAASVPDGTERGLEVFASTSASASLTESAGTYLELYSIVPPEGPNQTFVDGGVTYGLTHRLQVDGWLGLEVGAAPARFVGIGASYLL